MLDYTPERSPRANTRIQRRSSDTRLAASASSRGQSAYGVPVRIFSGADVPGILDTAAGVGLQPTGPLSLACKDRIVRWQKVSLDFTLISFALRKGPAAMRSA
jgi:hypothetical protein